MIFFSMIVHRIGGKNLIKIILEAHACTNLLPFLTKQLIYFPNIFNLKSVSTVACVAGGISTGSKIRKAKEIPSAAKLGVFELPVRW
jgi:hypothetical protein